MNIWDILILLAVAAAVIFAVIRIRRRKKAGRGCCGSCSLCRASCPSGKRTGAD